MKSKYIIALFIFAVYFLSGCNDSINSNNTKYSSALSDILSQPAIEWNNEDIHFLLNTNLNDMPDEVSDVYLSRDWVLYYIYSKSCIYNSVTIAYNDSDGNQDAIYISLRDASEVEGFYLDDTVDNLLSEWGPQPLRHIFWGNPDNYGLWRIYIAYQREDLVYLFLTDTELLTSILDDEQSPYQTREEILDSFYETVDPSDLHVDQVVIMRADGMYYSNDLAQYEDNYFPYRYYVE